MTQTLSRRFFAAVLPSMLAFMFSGIYAIVDGFFVGRNVGDNGLAAVNLAYPLVAFLQAVGTGVGMGGSIHVSVERGKGRQDLQQDYAKITLTLLPVCALLIMTLLFFTYIPILKLFGAQGEVLKLSKDYMLPIIFGAVFQIMGTGLVPLLRNFDNSLGAMLAMISGFVTNVILDWLLVSVYPFGVTGAALATVIGQGVTLLFCAFFLARQKLFSFFFKGKLSLKKILVVLMVALSPFGLTMSPNIVIIIINKAAAFFGTTKDVACFAVISYTICIVQLLLQGIGDGCQPLISDYFGRKDKKSTAALRKYAYLTSVSAAVLCVIILYFFRNTIPVMFGTSKEVAVLIARVLPVFLIGLLFVSFLRVTISYFYAASENLLAYILIYGEPLLLTVWALILPRLLGTDGIWASVPLNQFCLAALALFLLIYTERRARHTV